MPSTIFTGKVLIELKSIPSTNSYSQELLVNGNVFEGTLISTAFQTGGKGYGSNIWESAAGENLLISIVLKPLFLLPRHQFFLNQAISLAVAETVSEATYHDNIKIKWPNDIFIDDKKVAGILIENSIQGNQLQHAVIGIGLNVNQLIFSQQIKNVTSLRQITGEELDIKKVRDLLCEKIEARYLQLKNKKIDQLQKDYMKQLYRVEEDCMFRSKGERFNGKIVGLTPEGKLILQLHDHHEVFGFKEVEMII